MANIEKILKALKKNPPKPRKSGVDPLRILEYYKIHGGKIEKIAYDAECSDTTVIRYLKQHGLPYESNSDGFKKYEEKIISLHSECNGNASEAARVLGKEEGLEISYTTVRNYWRKYGFPQGKHGGKRVKLEKTSD